MSMELPSLKKPSLSGWWLDRLSERMEKHYPDVIGHGVLVDAWKVDGWNDGTSTLYGVYKIGDSDAGYIQCVFADYSDPVKRQVKPKFEHTGWRAEYA